MLSLTFKVSLKDSGRFSEESYSVDAWTAHLNMNDSIRSSFYQVKKAMDQRSIQWKKCGAIARTAPLKMLCNTAKPHLTFVRFVKSFSMRLPTSR